MGALRKKPQPLGKKETEKKDTALEDVEKLWQEARGILGTAVVKCLLATTAELQQQLENSDKLKAVDLMILRATFYSAQTGDLKALNKILDKLLRDTKDGVKDPNARENQLIDMSDKSVEVLTSILQIVSRGKKDVGSNQD